MRSQELNEDFFDLLYKSQSSRMNDQRCDFPISRNTFQPPQPQPQQQQQGAAAAPGDDSITGERKDVLVDMIVRMQGDRMDEQRSEFPGLSNSGMLSNIV